jgi:hypothetical protein
VSALELKSGDLVLVEAGDFIPSDGDVIEGVASVDESAITGESAPVIRESGGDRSAVTGGTRVLSDWIKVRITAAQGSTFLDRMIALVEGAVRQKTPNEIWPTRRSAAPAPACYVIPLSRVLAKHMVARQPLSRWPGPYAAVLSLQFQNPVCLRMYKGTPSHSPWHLRRRSLKHWMHRIRGPRDAKIGCQPRHPSSRSKISWRVAVLLGTNFFGRFKLL